MNRRSFFIEAVRVAETWLPTIILQSTKWQRIRNYIDAAMIFARANFVNVHLRSARKQRKEYQRENDAPYNSKHDFDSGLGGIDDWPPAIGASFGRTGLLDARNLCRVESCKLCRNRR
jgi:hypothetical protein